MDHAPHPTRLLILGGTTEASGLARALAVDARVHVTLSLAGRTQCPVAQPVPVRSGGFGGADGLARYLEEDGIEAVIDATHPFAAQMCRHAVIAARQTATPLLAICRPPWTAVPGDRWTRVADLRAAVAALGPIRRRVLLTIGQQELAPFTAAPWHDYLVRSIERPPPDLLPAGALFIGARGPFAFEAEQALLLERQIEVLVTKNSGGGATRAKLDAARALSIEVVMVARPPRPDGVETVHTVAAAVAWLEALHGGALRGE